jgi:hypothetical protein
LDHVGSLDDQMDISRKTIIALWAATPVAVFLLPLKD